MQAIEKKHQELATRLAARDDRFSQLVARMIADEQSGVELHSRSGLSEAEHAELDALRAEAHARFQKEIIDATSRIRGLLTEGDPLRVLSMIRAQNLLAPVGSYYEPTHRGLESNVELVAGLLLTQAPPTQRGETPDEIVTAISDEIGDLNDLLLLRNLSAPTDDGVSMGELRFSGALHWMTVRGTSYAHHGAELAQALYRPFDQRCLKTYGFTVDDVLSVGTVSEEITQLRMDEALLRAVATANAAMANLAAAQPPTGPEAQHEMVQEGARVFANTLARDIVECSTFTSSDLVAAGLETDRVDAVLRELSLPAGGLDAGAYSGVFDRSPLVTHPFFELAGRYMLVVPGTVLRDTVVLLQERLTAAVPNFSARRAKTLDALAVTYLTELLEGSSGYTNLFYDEFELDGLLLFERMALVVEGKASPLSAQAQRGDLTRLARDISRSVEDAWRQGARARDYLLSGQDAVFHDDRGRETLRVPAASIDEVVIVNPTLHHSPATLRNSRASASSGCSPRTNSLGRSSSTIFASSPKRRTTLRSFSTI